MKNVLAMILAGGVGSRLNVLAKLRAKPAVPFAGIYRIIDFTLSNIVNSQIEKVGVLTQYKPYSLMKHIGTGAQWDFIGRSRSVKILPPTTGEKNSDWYKGTADAIYQNISFIHRHNPDYVLILSGDHIYHMNYNNLLDFHKEKGADVTIGMIKVPKEKAHQFGIGIIDNNRRIIDWEEKSPKPKSTLVSMGIYIFNTEFLIEHLCDNIGYDFGNDIIPHIIKDHNIYSYLFDSYWQDVGTIQSYWETNMDILKTDSKLSYDNWKVYTNIEEEDSSGDRMPSYIGKSAIIKNSIISANCVIEGQVINSILSPGVRLKNDTIVKDSIIMHDCIINENCIVDYAILDKNITIASNCKIGFGNNDSPNIKYPEHLSSGLVVIGKDNNIEKNIKIGKNCIIAPNLSKEKFQSTQIICGTTIE